MTFLDSMAPLSGIPFISNGSLQISADRVSTAERALALSCGRPDSQLFTGSSARPVGRAAGQ